MQGGCWQSRIEGSSNAAVVPPRTRRTLTPSRRHVRDAGAQFKSSARCGILSKNAILRPWFSTCPFSSMVSIRPSLREESRQQAHRMATSCPSSNNLRSSCRAPSGSGSPRGFRRGRGLPECVSPSRTSRAPSRRSALVPSAVCAKMLPGMTNTSRPWSPAMTP